MKTLTNKITTFANGDDVEIRVYEQNDSFLRLEITLSYPDNRGRYQINVLDFEHLNDLLDSLHESVKYLKDNYVTVREIIR